MSNGRASRLLFLLACYHCGIEAGRYISLERIIEENKERYYEVLEQSSQRWHEGKHDPWPAMNFLLFILTQACKEFEQRLGQLKSPRGEKPRSWKMPSPGRPDCSASQICKAPVRASAWISFAAS